MSRTVVGAVGVIALAGLLVLSSLAQSPKAEADEQKADAASGETSAASSENKADPADEKKTDATDDEAGEEVMIDPMGPNSACYVCHTTFVWEELCNVHLPEKVTCVECHGLSAAHANDEDIGATPPDVTFERSKIDASCEECHEEHDVSARDIIERWIDRKLSSFSPVCTDCHGTHKIETPEESEPDDKEEEEADGKEGDKEAETSTPAEPSAAPE
jgi:hypothetical protein